MAIGKRTREGRFGRKEALWKRGIAEGEGWRERLAVGRLDGQERRNFGG